MWKLAIPFFVLISMITMITSGAIYFGIYKNDDERPVPDFCSQFGISSFAACQHPQTSPIVDTVLYDLYGFPIAVIRSAPFITDQELHYQYAFFPLNMILNLLWIGGLSWGIARTLRRPKKQPT